MCWGNISEQNNDLFLCSAYVLVGGEAIARHCMLKIVIAIRKEQVEQGPGRNGLGKRTVAELGLSGLASLRSDI